MTEDAAIQPFLGGDRVRIKPGVRRVRRVDSLLLVPPEGNPVMVTPLVDEIWDALVAGIQVSELATELRARHPRARDVTTKLTLFLNRLWIAGLLEGSAAATALPLGRNGIQIPIDRLACVCVVVVKRIPRPIFAALVAGLASASAYALVLLLMTADHPRLSQIPSHITIPGLLFIVCVMAPLHELGHAVTCRLVGAPSGPLTIRLGKLWLPRPYVDTSLAWLVEQPKRRGWIPAGGPLVDLLIGGMAASLVPVLNPASTPGSVAWLAALYAYVAVNVGTSPLLVGDGSHMLEALLNDEFARGAALLGRHHRFVRPQSVKIYRSVCIGHLLLSLVLFACLR